MRIGFTTGSAVSAAAKAAILRISGKKLKNVNIPLPDGSRMSIPVRESRITGKNKAYAEVIKDSGDDPDVTDGIRIMCFVEITEGNRIRIEAGKGIGIVTKPGLPVPVGSPAINPYPRRQIREAIIEGLKEAGLFPSSVKVRIEIPEGEKIAKKTLNPKLGIVGGISILGTRGTVIPFSHEAYKRTIEVELDFAISNGAEKIVFVTGGRTERFSKRIYRELKDFCFIQIGDFFGFCLEQAAKRSLKHIIFSCLFGKLIKIAQGASFTHVKESQIDFSLLSEWCNVFGLKIKNPNTALQAFEMIKNSEDSEKVFSFILEKAILNARKYISPYQKITFNLFDYTGNLICQKEG